MRLLEKKSLTKPYWCSFRVSSKTAESSMMPSSSSPSSVIGKWKHPLFFMDHEGLSQWVLVKSQVDIHFISLCSGKGVCRSRLWRRHVCPYCCGHGIQRRGRAARWSLWGVRFSLSNVSWTQCSGNLRLSLVYSKLLSLIPSFPMSFPFSSFPFPFQLCTTGLCWVHVKHFVAWCEKCSKW